MLASCGSHLATILETLCVRSGRVGCLVGVGGEADVQMRGQKVMASVNKSRKGKSVLGASATGASPSVSKKEVVFSAAMCDGCGVPITAEVRALQCDRCLKNWKCSDCLNIGEHYEKIIECKELSWLCGGCNKTVTDVDSIGNRDDKLVEMMGMILEKVSEVEIGLRQKADSTAVEELEGRVKRLEERFKTAVGKEDSGYTRNEEGNNQMKSAVVIEVGRRIEEEKEVERRRRNIVIYRVAETLTNNADERKKDDLLFLSEMCSRGLGVEVEKKDVEQLYRLGRREEGRDRPLLVKFVSEEKKQEVMDNLKELRESGEERFRRVSVSHDLTWRQRERVKEVRKKALEELEEEKKEQGEGSQAENFRIIVVGQQSSNPRAVKVPVRRM